MTGTWSTGADLLLSGLVADTEYTLTFGVDNIEPNVECTDTIVFSTSSCGEGWLRPDLIPRGYKLWWPLLPDPCSRSGG